MCTIAILVGVSDAPIVLAANRDELYARPTRAPEILAPGIAGGVDALSGGTWLALRRDGAFAAVTNQRQLAPPSAEPGLRSRGLAVRELAAAADQDAYVAALDPRAYASMNLVWGDARGASIAYLRRESAAHDVVRLARGVHVLCNDVLGSSGFPRGERLRAGIDDALARDARWDALAPRLAALLADHTHTDPPPPSSHLPDAIARELTATCIHTPLYGTRSATLAAIGPTGVRAYLHADGAPCVTAFVDRTELLR
jgi:uncharacterized protein with NRDE domain